MYSISLLMPAPPEQHPAGDDVDEDGGTRAGEGVFLKRSK